MTDRFNTVFTPFVDKGIKFLKKSLASQAFKDEADINSIMRKYKTIDNYNALHPGRVVQPQYGDFSQMMKGDYMKALVTVANANEAFALLPAEVRAKFNNNPAEAIKFAGSKDNREVAIALGLVPQPAKEAGSEQLTHIASGEPASVEVKTEA